MPKKKTKGKKPRKRTYRRKKKFSFKRWLFKWTFIISVWLAIALVFMLIYYSYDLPDIRVLNEDYKTPTIKVLDRQGNLIASAGELYGEYITYQDLPQHLIDAVISTEDRRFFSHKGADPIGLFRAAYANFQAGRVVQGGSTITQQLVKVVFLTPERTIKRKVQELLLALYIEKHYSKQEILTMYLNRIYFGSGNYGIDAATKTYFNKHVSDITLYESATLAGLIKAPSRYSPLNNFELSQTRADQVLRGMVDNNVLTMDEILTNSHKAVTLINPKSITSQYPYFTDWIKDRLKDYIGNSTEEITVITTIDPKIQHIATKALTRHLTSKGKAYNITQGAVVVLSPIGEVLAMVGGKSYKKSQFNRATQALRQPGSAFKMFVYLTAMEQGYTPNDIFEDSEIEIDGWNPKNWDKKYRGEVTLKKALAQSINTVAVKLAGEVGIRNVINTAYKLGITSNISNNLSSALGASEVTLLELTGAYAHLANHGNSVWIHGINEVFNSSGEQIFARNISNDNRIISPQSTAYMNDMLIHVMQLGTGRRAQYDHQAAGKTGTSQNSRDAWFIGYTGDLITGVWLGNDNNTPMSKVGGGGLPALVWKDIMSKASPANDSTQLPTTTQDLNVIDSKRSIIDNILSGFSNPPRIEHKYPNSN